MPKIHEITATADTQFKSRGIASHRLDAEVLLAYSLGVPRSWLHAHSGDEVTPERTEQFNALVKRRLGREPVAYITGRKEFYGREFIVTPDVLIPRPETEELVELAQATETPLSSIDDARRARLRVLDVGCGSGCIGITLKLEHPELDVTLCDISPKALDVARNNAKKLGATVQFAQSNLLSSFLSSESQKVDIVVANLPYVDRTWETSPETAHEPSLALYADNGGLGLINTLIEQSTVTLNDKGLLLLEADPEQHTEIIKEAQKHGFGPLEVRGYALSFMKLKQA